MLSKELELTLNIAFKSAKEKRHEFMTVEHLLLALLDNPAAIGVLRACGGNIENIRDELTVFIDETTPLIPATDNTRETQPTLGFQRVLQRAVFQAQSAGKLEVSGANVLSAMFSEQESQAVYFLKRENVTRLDIVNYISHGIAKIDHHHDDQEHHHDHQESQESDPNEMDQGFDSEPQEENRKPLEKYAVNLNEKAKLDLIDPLIGRAEELERTIQILCRRRKNNPLFVGEAGVGKTAIAEGLAKAIVEGNVPEVIKDSTIYSLDLGALLAGTKYRGDFEKRFKSLLKDLKNEAGAVLFIDEIHTIIGAGAASGGVMDASNLIKPLLSGGSLKCMGSTTYQEYRGIFEKDQALARRFQKIDVKETDIDETYHILKGLKSHFEAHHDIKFSNKALRAAAELSGRYLPDRFMPDKAIDVVDETGAYQRLLPESKRKKLIGVHDIEQIIAKIARVPEKTISVSDKEQLRNLERDLKLLIFGQDNAVEALSSAIKLSRSGIGDSSKPTASFLFSGPTGVGKTEMTRQLAKLMGVEFLRFDMSEYMERHTVSRLIGAPPGYVGFDQGGLLTEAVNKHPYCVLLLDEIEKAHPDIFNILLQVMDHGTLTDSNGRKVDFRQVVIVLTTNAGAELASRGTMGFAEQDHSSESTLAVNNLFPPEFRNRLDGIIDFKALSDETICSVVDKFVAELEVMLSDKGVTLDMDDGARHWLAEHGYDAQMGARPMARLIQEELKQPLAEELLFGELTQGGVVHVSIEGAHLAVSVEGRVANASA